MIDAATPLSHQGLASGLLTGKLTFPCSSPMRNAWNSTPSLSTAKSTRHDIDTRSANDNAQTKASSLRSKQSQFALHSPLATHLVPRSQPPIEARNRRTRYIIERWSPRAGAVVRARRLRAVAGTGPRLLLSNAPPRGPLTALARDGGPTSSEAGSAAGPPGLSNVLRARGPAPES
jgi:hypothetical protein